MFQIDAQLFPGSSGGLVISKPTHFAFIDGKPMYSENEQFVFLGVYSGEYTFDDEIENFNEIGDYSKNYIKIEEKNGKLYIKRSYGLGNVWYSHLIPEIIKEGISLSNNSII